MTITKQLQENGHASASHPQFAAQQPYILLAQPNASPHAAQKHMAYSASFSPLSHAFAAMSIGASQPNSASPFHLESLQSYSAPAASLLQHLHSGPFFVAEHHSQQPPVLESPTVPSPLSTSSSLAVLSSSATSTIPSKVVHFRNVISDITQADLLNLCAPFGRVTHILLLKNAQALVQFADLSSAISFIQYFGNHNYQQTRSASIVSNGKGSLSTKLEPTTTSIDGDEPSQDDLLERTDSANSEHDERDIDDLGLHDDNVPATDDDSTGTKFVQDPSYLGKAQANIRGVIVYPSFSSHQELSKGALNGNNENEKKNRILLVTIFNVQYMVNVDVLYQVFSYYGPIEKIVMFNKTAGLQGLIQFKSLDDAVNAKCQMHGQSLYANACALSIQYSNLTDLTVHQNSDRARDYTKPHLPTEAPTFPSLFSQVPYSTTWFHTSGNSTSSTPVLLQQQFRDSDKTVLLVSNFNEKKLDCDKIFNLFSCYGYIVRIKIFRSKTDHALIQMATNQQASTAIACLKGVEVFGKKLSVNFSRHTHINATDGNDQFTKDYSKTSWNRFPANTVTTNSTKLSGGSNGSLPATSPTTTTTTSTAQQQQLASKKVRYMCHPTHTIHISNLDSTTDHKQLMETFGEFGEVDGVRMFEHNSKHMALIKFKTVPSAVAALCTRHNAPLKRNVIKISFSTNKL